MSAVEGWKSVSLGQLVTVQGGFAFKSEDFLDNGIPIVRMSDLSSGKLDLHDAVYVEESIAERLSSFQLKDGDYLVGMSGSIGNFAIVTEQDLPALLNQRVGRLCLRDCRETNYPFIRHVARSNEYIRHIELLAAGAAQLNISSKQIESYRLLVPPLPEQAKIAEVLSTVDRAIEQTEALIEKQQRIKTGLMADLLTRGIDAHGNLRSEATHAFKDSPLGRIPVEWEVKTIDELTCRVGSGVTPTGGDSVYSKEGILFIRSQNVYNDGLHLEDVAYISEQIHASMLRSEVFEHDVLLNITGASIGRCCRMPAREGKANVNQHVCAIRLAESDEQKANWLASVIQSPIGQNQIAQFNAGGNREGLNFEQIRSFQIPWPTADLGEFTRAQELVLNLSKQSNEARATMNKLRSLKTALMQDLLTGKKRVTNLLEN